MTEQKWIIRSVGGYIAGISVQAEIDEETQEPLYWSNDDGWVSRDTATQFDSNNYTLPHGGAWEGV